MRHTNTRCGSRSHWRSARSPVSPRATVVAGLTTAIRRLRAADGIRFCYKMVDFALTMMDFVFKMMIFGRKPNGTKLAPTEWRNGALIQKVGSSFYKLVWGEQFGFGVRTGALSPNATGKSHVSVSAQSIILNTQSVILNAISIIPNTRSIIC